MSTAPEPDDCLRIPEVARKLGVTRSTVYRYIEDGLLPVVHIGPRRMTRITREALADYIRQSGKAA